ncbi:unnamed protein product [Nezara viridula]|nr:unnamed protein product [Nezara viridula]
MRIVPILFVVLSCWGVCSGMHGVVNKKTFNPNISRRCSYTVCCPVMLDCCFINTFCCRNHVK